MRATSLEKQNIVTFLLFVGVGIIIGIWASEMEQFAIMR